MSPLTFDCGEVSSRLHGYADGTLPAMERRLIESHLECCSICRADLAAVVSIETRLRELWRARSAPAPTPELWGQIRIRLAAFGIVQRRSDLGLRRGWQRAATAVAMVAAVAGTTIVAYREVETRRAEARFVRAPIEDLRAYVDSRRLMDVATADLNELRKWFRGRIDFPIPGPGIGDSVRLAGGRLCFFLDRRIASTIYQAANGRIVSLYIIPAHLNSLHSDASRVVAGEPVNLKSLGSYTQVMWRRGEIIYALVGELSTEQMMELSSVFLRSTLDPA